MAIDATARSSRRALLLGASGAVGALTMHTLGRPIAVEATHGDVHLGSTNTATETTWIQTTNRTAIAGHSDAVHGVHGSSGSGNGLNGDSQTGHGVYGSSNASTGVYGQSGAASGAAVFGNALTGGAGVFGHSGDGINIPAPAANTGVAGHADIDAEAVGVRGSSPTGRGGVFNGHAAQVRLLPSAAASHPRTGRAGDLFVDASKRLWFCRGGLNWVRLA